MVKTFEEENSFNKKRLEILYSLVIKYTKEAYKQFKWESNIILNKGDPFFFLRTKIIYAREKVILIRGDLADNNNIKISVGYEKYFYSAEMKIFPISTELPPKEIAKVAQNIFKWIKQEMQKI